MAARRRKESSSEEEGEEKTVVNVVQDDESEEDECLDMSNPLAHVKKAEKTKSDASKSDKKDGGQRQVAIHHANDGDSGSKRADKRKETKGAKQDAVAGKNKRKAPSPAESEVDEALPRPRSSTSATALSESEEDEDLSALANERKIVVDEAEAEEPKAVSPAKPKITLSKWASRFLVPRAHVTVVEEPDLEPMQDFILDDFRTRFRGDASEKPHLEEAEGSDSEAESEIPLVVGAPIAQVNPPKAEKSEKEKTDKSEKADKPEKTKSESTKVKKESRYFLKDLTTKCFNCGEVGHMSTACVNSTVLRPCFLCGYRDHKSVECPFSLCHRCNEPGHESRNCTNSRSTLDYCGICGSSNHYERQCKPRDSDVTNVRCMVCFERGHLNCVPISRPTDRRLFCPKCCGAHTYEECHRGSSFNNGYRGERRDYDNRSSAKECYECGQVGHISSMCPEKRSSKHQRFDEGDRNSRPPKRQKRDEDRYSSKRKYFN